MFAVQSEQVEKLDNVKVTDSYAAKIPESLIKVKSSHRILKYQPCKPHTNMWYHLVVKMHKKRDKRTKPQGTVPKVNLVLRQVAARTVYFTFSCYRAVHGT